MYEARARAGLYLSATLSNRCLSRQYALIACAISKVCSASSSSGAASLAMLVG